MPGTGVSSHLTMGMALIKTVLTRNSCVFGVEEGGTFGFVRPLRFGATVCVSAAIMRTQFVVRLIRPEAIVF